MRYDLINLSTVMNPDPKLGGLSFFEGTRDIPFEIKDFTVFLKQNRKHIEDFGLIKQAVSCCFARMVPYRYY